MPAAVTVLHAISHASPVLRIDAVLVALEKCH
jgi:hypothetical protein